MSSIDAADADQLRYPKESSLSELESVGSSSVLCVAPSHLHPQVKAVCERFTEALENWSEMTSELCYAQLHQDWTGERKDLFSRIEAACINQAAKKRFHDSLRTTTLPGKLKASFGLYLDGLIEPAALAFESLVAIGDRHPKGLSSSPVEWARQIMTLLIRSQRREAGAWIRQTCESRDAEWIGWEDWCAPRLLQMAWGTASFEADRLWEPLSAQRSWRLVQAFADKYVLRLIHTIEAYAREAVIEWGIRTTSKEADASARSKNGRPPKHDEGFVRMAGRLWRENQDAKGFVSDEALGTIAAEFDKSPFKNPSDHFPGKSADDLNSHNMKFGNSPKKLLTWTDVASKNVRQFYFKRTLRKWLSECARQSEK